ncbi:23S rRNA pseudouridine(2605) synthase [Saliniradius amylolyticus]|uniref:Pseudouridine synthase n=1 Tax=Saliniradius amylolyticus TaxID=2183582 RepID=A0A2S2E3D0_9ALTE|nr:23S rRNA pseudouridine(2605) synthase RluB [Saliniradius amylolyticus]AWL12148.1 23S rRNA pseudouridine(2605) synthase [Saliniradius amylolyticus]
MSEKLQKVLANQGIGSRREMERWIEQGRISVNGQVATLGCRVEEDDEIRVDGRRIERSKEKSICRVLMYNKPEGEVCTRKDPEGRPTVFERLPRISQGRWMSIGRLDINTSGLLLFTTDGELANRLMHPSHEVERQYAVRIFGKVEDAVINRLKRGVLLEDGEARFGEIRRHVQDEESINQWFDVTLYEGRHREVRRLWESQDLTVSRLIRTHYGGIGLAKRLPQGGFIELGLKDVNHLRKQVQLPPEKETLLKPDQQQLDHVRISRMRRAARKHQLKRKKD